MAVVPSHIELVLHVANLDRLGYFRTSRLDAADNRWGLIGTFEESLFGRGCLTRRSVKPLVSRATM